MKRKKPRRKRDKLDEELAALVVCSIDDDGSSSPVGVYTVPADLAPEAHIPGLTPLDDLEPRLPGLEPTPVPSEKSALARAKSKE